MLKIVTVSTAVLLAGCAQIMEGQARNLSTMRVQEAVSGYETARRKANPLDMCVKARLVAIAYADAKEAGNAEAWKAREREDCAAATAAMGIQRPGAEPAL